MHADVNRWVLMDYGVITHLHVITKDHVVAAALHYLGMENILPPQVYGDLIQAPLSQQQSYFKRFKVVMLPNNPGRF